MLRGGLCFLLRDRILRAGGFSLGDVPNNSLNGVEQVSEILHHLRLGGYLLGLFQPCCKAIQIGEFLQPIIVLFLVNEFVNAQGLLQFFVLYLELLRDGLPTIFSQ